MVYLCNESCFSQWEMFQAFNLLPHDFLHNSTTLLLNYYLQWAGFKSHMKHSETLEFPLNLFFTYAWSSICLYLLVIFFRSLKWSHVWNICMDTDVERINEWTTLKAHNSCTQLSLMNKFKFLLCKKSHTDQETFEL